MARTKGSKGKKTLAKEMGITLEEYEKYLSMSPEEKEEFLGSLNKTKKEIENISPLIKINSEINSSSTDDKLPTEEDKNYSELEKAPSTEEEKIPVKSKTKKSEFPTCDRCHTEIKCNSRKINLTYLSGAASYHRFISNEQPVLCSKCSLALSKLIEEFLFDNGKGISLKYGMTTLNPDTTNISTETIEEN